MCCTCLSLSFKDFIVDLFQGIATFIGIPFSKENQQKDFSYSVTLFEEECLPEPELLLFNSVFPLSVILLTLLIMSLMAAKVSQLRLMVCERFFTATGDTRVEYLHRKILRRRRKLSMENDDSSFKSFIVKVCFYKRCNLMCLNMSPFL